MTDNQTNQMFDLLTKCVSSIQELKAGQERIETTVNIIQTDVTELKTDVIELKNDVGDLKEGQNRIERQMRLNDAAVDSLAGEQMRLKVAVANLEKPNV